MVHNKTYKLLHNQGNRKQNEKTTCGPGKKYLQTMRPTRALFSKCTNTTQYQKRTNNPVNKIDSRPK